MRHKLEEKKYAPYCREFVISKIFYLRKLCESLLQENLDDTVFASFIESPSYWGAVKLKVTYF